MEEDYLAGIGLDMYNNCYIGGSANINMYFSSDTLGRNPFSDQYDPFIACFSPKGNLKWAKHPDNQWGTFDDKAYDFFVDENGFSYVTGFAQAWFTFGPYTINTPSIWNEGFYLKFDSTGTAIGSFQTKHPQYWATFDALSVIPGTQEIVATGRFNTSVFIGRDTLTGSNGSTFITTLGHCTPSISYEGPLRFCASEKVTLTLETPLLANHDYQWLRNGNPIFGETSRTLNPTTSGRYSVKVSDSICEGVSTSILVEILSFPAKPDILGRSAICSGDSSLLQASVFADKYRWSTGDSNQNISVKDSGIYQVVAIYKNGCESEPSDIFELVFYKQPATPTIVERGVDTLHCLPIALGFRWFLENQLLPDTTSFIHVKQSGNYAVQIRDSLCYSDTSDFFFHIISNLEAIQSGSPKVFPNPGQGNFFIENKGSKYLEVYDLFGKQLYSKTMLPYSTQKVFIEEKGVLLWFFFDSEKKLLEVSRIVNQ